MPSTEEDIQQWFEDQYTVKEKKVPQPFKLPTWDQMKYEFRVQLYAKAIGKGE